MTDRGAHRCESTCMTIHVPLAFRRRGGRKQVVSTEGALASMPRSARIDSTLVKAVARAYRWQRMLEGGQFESIAELATSERINPSYLARVLRLTLLAPDIITAILDGRCDAQRASVANLTRGFPAEWCLQRLAAGENCRLPN